jgi:hypothetical protein
MNKQTDLNGCPYALVSEVDEGTIIIVDDAFDCMNAFSEKIVKIDQEKISNSQEYTYNECLYIECEEGKHFLDGQIEEREGFPEFYIGIYLKKNFKL